MIATTVQSFVNQIDELLSKMKIKQEPIIIERAEGNLVVMPQVDFDNIMLALHKKKKEQEEYAHLQEIFFQSSRQAMADKMEKYLD